MRKALKIETNTEQLSYLRFQNSCLEDFLKTASKDDKICECLHSLHNSVSQLTNLYTKEIDEYEECLISETRVFNRMNSNKESKQKFLNLLN